MNAKTVKATNREEWLTRAVKPLCDMIVENTSLPRPKEVTVSCGWPRQDRGGKVIGQCWPTKSGKGVSHMFITPMLTDPIKVLATLLHELIHAADDCASEHKGPFTKAVRAVGLSGKPTATFADPGTALHASLKALAKELGKYPHTGLTPGGTLAKKQSTRMLKCECDSCGYVVRTTQKWLDIATPICPLSACGLNPLTIEEK